MTVAEILTQAGETEADALREHAVLLSLSKVSRYEAECSRFQSKYCEAFDVFRDRVKGMQDAEDFQLEDDLMDWEFAHVSLQWWNSRVEDLRNAG